MLSGRLAQLVEHPLDVREVTGSSPVSSTKKRLVFVEIRGVFLVVGHFLPEKVEVKISYPLSYPLQLLDLGDGVATDR